MKNARSESVAWVCETCGVQTAPTMFPPKDCPICLDERQYVGWMGQRWTTVDDVRQNREIIFAKEAGVTTMVLQPGFAINQRAFLIPHAGGHIMWECLATVTEEAVARIRALGRITHIAISHPHFYAAMVEWSAALGGVPIYLHAEDRYWVQRPSEHIRFWDGDAVSLTPSIQLVRLAGHFDGSAGLWWADGPRKGGSLFPGDAIQVAMDRRFTTFMYSYPNGIPLNAAAIMALRARVQPLEFDDVFGFSTGRQIIGHAKARVNASFDRYRSAVAV
ncbi:MAG: MBL fold metallo-hydrolase [Sphingomonadales bacterium]